ncbi:hypothetical protein WJX75_001921 [Coccomyxa subellipsoidea]|uniref:Luciferase-like domain-containing protein n=1 Tax=Coccomyxa subellipsoidea TaxID=248742 RepID=A0ABR2YEL9_9CHLO
MSTEALLGRGLDGGTSVDADRQPWAALIFPKHPDREDSLIGDSPRSVQTALSVAESIGYNTEFVLPLEDAHCPEFKPVPDGILLASVLCLCALVLLFATATSYVVLVMVA